MYRRSVGERIFDTLNVIFMIIFSFCVYILLHTFNISISEGASSAQYTFIILPRITLANYKFALGTSAIPTGFKNSIIRTVGTALSVIMTACGAYPLSKKNLPNRNLWTTIILIPMFFGGGLIPSYLLMKSLNLINTRWALFSQV